MSYIKSNELFEKIPTEELYNAIPRPIIIADHLMTPDNMGAMIRIADNIGATEMCFLGQESKHSLGKVRRAAASSRGNIRWYFTEETDLHAIVPKGKTIVAIETADDATCIYDTQLPDDVAFIVGSESQGLNESLLEQCDMSVYIPVPGPTRSLNVSHAAAVALFEWQRQMLLRHGGEMKDKSSSRPAKQYKHVFFDIDRTLWDFESSSMAVFEMMYEKYHLKDLGIPSAEHFHETYHPHNKMLWELYRENKITKEDLNKSRFQYPLQQYGIVDEELAQNLSHDYVYYSPRTVRIMPGAIEILEYLKPKYHLHLITNGFQEVQDVKLKGAGFAPYFETMTVSEKVGIKKPDPGIFLYALQQAGATAEESVMIGDEMEVDIDGARAAHIDQIFFNPNELAVDGDRTYEVKTLLEIKKLL